MTTVSKKLKEAVKLNPMPAYKIAQKAGVNPSTLSHLLLGITTAKTNDPRIIAVGKIIGISESECFELVEGTE